MARFRVLSSGDVLEILSLFGVPAGRYRRHEALSAGTINTNVLIENSDRTLFLRINEGKTLDDVTREAAVVAHLAAQGVLTPSPLSALSGEPFARWRDLFASLFPWLPGRVLARAEVQPDHARQVGQALGRMHRVGKTFPDHRPGRYEPDEIDRRLARVADAAAATGDAALRAALARLQPALADLARVRRADLPLGLIHGDLFIDNVLFDGVRMTALLDFEQASWGRLAYDLAVTTLAFGFGHNDFRPEVVAALYAGYASERALTAAEREGFGAELRFAACRFAVTRITDVYLKRTAGAAPGKDFHRYLQRLDRIEERMNRLASGDLVLQPP